MNAILPNPRLLRGRWPLELANHFAGMSSGRCRGSRAGRCSGIFGEIQISHHSKGVVGLFPIICFECPRSSGDKGAQ